MSHQVKQHKYPGSLRSAGRGLPPEDVVEIDTVLDEAFSHFPNEILKCYKECQMFRKGICESTGQRIRVGSDCVPQRISREMSS